MPFALVTIGLILVVTGAKNTYAAFGKQLAGDFTGKGNFLYWIASLGVVGSLGYIPQLRRFSHIFMALIIVAMILANANPNAAGGGFFAKFTQFMQSGPTAPAASPTTAENAPAVMPSTLSSSPALDAAKTAAQFAPLALALV